MTSERRAVFKTNLPRDVESACMTDLQTLIYYERFSSIALVNAMQVL